MPYRLSYFCFHSLLVLALQVQNQDRTIKGEVNIDEHRQRFELALNHQEPDRIPMAFGGPECSINVSAAPQTPGLLRFQSEENIKLLITSSSSLSQMSDYMIFDVDVRWIIPHEPPVNWSVDREMYVDEFGRRFKAGGGFYNQIDTPCKKSTEEDWRDTGSRPDEHDRMAGIDKARDPHQAGYGLTGDGAWGSADFQQPARSPKPVP
jgi:hypothetical protein